MATTETSIWSIGPTVLLPTMLYGIGQGAVVPVVALTARDLGASVAVAGLTVALLGLGKIVGDVPAGILAARIGERQAMLAAIAGALVATAVCLLAPNVGVLAIGVTLLGLAQSVWGLARHAYLTEVMPYHMRARALSTLAGALRVGLFVGPFVSALAIGSLGTDGAYWVHGALSVAAGVVLLIFPDPELGEVGPKPEGKTSKQHDPAEDESVGTLALIRRHRQVLFTLGVGAMLFNAVRLSRPLVIPLWADHIGLDAASTSLIFGIAGALEMLLFYPAGQVMDKWGRRWIAIPSTIMFGVGYLLVPFTDGMATLTAVALLMGLAGGVSSGIIMTIGADASPSVNRSEFLGMWRFCSDLGGGLGPAIVSGLVAVMALAPAIMSLGLLSAFSAFALARWLPTHKSFVAARPPKAAR